MNILSLHHVPFEGLGSIEPLIAAGGHSLVSIPIWKTPVLPPISSFDTLIIMGGPMSVGDIKAHPWLTSEKKLIGRAIEAGRTVFGICLGAQLIAEAMGAEVYPGDNMEIGWFHVTVNP